MHAPPKEHACPLCNTGEACLCYSLGRQRAKQDSANPYKGPDQPNNPKLNAKGSRCICQSLKRLLGGATATYKQAPFYLRIPCDRFSCYIKGCRLLINTLMPTVSRGCQILLILLPRCSG